MKLFNGDCLEVMRTLEDNSIDSIVTDPPYGLSSPPDIKEVMRHWLDDKEYIHNGTGMMGLQWDAFVPNPVYFQEMYRVLKPGGHAFVFAGVRTQDLMGMSLRFAGFEIRDTMMWLFSTSMPKSRNFSLDINKINGGTLEKGTVKSGHEEFVDRTTTGDTVFKDGSKGFDRPWMHDEEKKEDYHYNKIVSDDEAKKWVGWGTGIKSCYEPIILVRKPLSEKTIALNVMKYGTGGLNIDATRVEYSDTNKPIPQLAQQKLKVNSTKSMYDGQSFNKSKTEAVIGGSLDGRFPSNVIWDGSDEIQEEFDKYGNSKESISRFFYSAKVSPSERNEGLDHLPTRQATGGGGGIGNYLLDVNSASGKFGSEKAPAKNDHPCLKPIALLSYLCKMITPPNGTVLDPYMGSGSTGISATKEGFDFVGIELDNHHFEIAEQRIEHHQNKQKPTNSLDDIFS